MQKRDKNGVIKDSLIQRLKSYLLGRKLRSGKIPRGRRIRPETAAKVIGLGCPKNAVELWGLLSARRIRATGEITDFGLISVLKITTAFRDYIVDSLQNSTTSPMDIFKYHGSGTGTTAEANTQTTLVTEVGSRVTGTQIEGATANIFKTVATVTYGSAYDITEHGIFSADTNGTMMDRSVFSAIGVASGDKIEFTYQGTFSAEA